MRAPHLVKPGFQLDLKTSLSVRKEKNSALRFYSCREASLADKGDEGLRWCYLVDERETSHPWWGRQWRRPEPAGGEQTRGREPRYCTASGGQSVGEIGSGDI